MCNLKLYRFNEGRKKKEEILNDKNQFVSNECS